MMIWAALFAAGAAALPVWGLYRLRSLQPGAVQLRRSMQAWGRQEGLWEMLARRLGLSDSDQLCQHAGRPFGLTGVSLFQVQLLSALTIVLVFSAISITFGLLVGIFGWFMPRVLLASMAQQRRSQIALELPAFLDLWGLLVNAGEGVETALVEICRRHPEWLLSTEMGRVRDRIAASGLFGESLVEEAKVTGAPEFIAVAEQVAHLADGGGVPSKELGRIAQQMREQRIAELVQSAGAMAIVGIFPKLGAIFLSLLPVLATVFLTVKNAM